MGKMLTCMMLVGAGILITGCASVKSNVAPGTDLSKIKTVYVEHQPQDKRQLDMKISNQFNAMGIKSTSGGDAAPADADAVVTYIDRWMWDITTYLMQLTIQVRDSKSNMIRASGVSYRPSLQRRSPEHMIEETLDAIFKKEE